MACHHHVVLLGWSLACHRHHHHHHHHIMLNSFVIVAVVCYRHCNSSFTIHICFINCCVTVSASASVNTLCMQLQPTLITLQISSLLMILNPSLYSLLLLLLLFSSVVETTTVCYTVCALFFCIASSTF